MNRYCIESTPSNDGRGYRVHIPRPLPMGPFGERYAAVVSDSRPLCHIGIINSGAMIAGCGIVGRILAGHKDDSFVDLDVRNPEPFDPAANIPVIVDNSVHEGTTIARAMGYLHRRFIRPELLVTLFDYDDEQEHAMRRWVTDEFGANVVSLFNHDDIVGR